MGILPQQLFCTIGDTVEFTREVNYIDNENIKAGDKYIVLNLVGLGWDLKRISGDGAEFVRLMNSELPNYIFIVKADTQ